MVPLDNWLRAHFGTEVPGSNLIVLGSILVLASLFLKRGLVGAVEDAWTLLRWRARR